MTILEAFREGTLVLASNIGEVLKASLKINIMVFYLNLVIN